MLSIFQSATYEAETAPLTNLPEFGCSDPDLRDALGAYLSLPSVVTGLDCQHSMDQSAIVHQVFEGDRAQATVLTAPLTNLPEFGCSDPDLRDALGACLSLPSVVAGLDYEHSMDQSAIVHQVFEGDRAQATVFTAPLTNLPEFGCSDPDLRDALGACLSLPSVVAGLDYEHSMDQTC